MASDRIVGIDLGTTNSLVAFMQGESPVVIPGEDEFDLDQRIQICEVEKKFDPNDSACQADAWHIDQELSKELGRLNREINASEDNERMADLYERYYVYDARSQKIKRVRQT
jgi:molecular chaperone DnaK (HSP70)